MKKLVFSYKGKELGRYYPGSPTILIGRSPACDFVVRAFGIRPVHFLMEWIGSGTFSATSGEWSITDVSAQMGILEKDLQGTSIGQGFILDQKSVKVGDFEFSWIDDRLSETILDGGALRQQVKGIENQQGSKGIDFSVLEVIKINAEADRVTNISHINLKSSKPHSEVLRDLPPMSLVWELVSSGDSLKVEINDSPSDLKVFQKGIQLNPSDKLKISMVQGDLVQIHWRLEDYFFRLVPAVKAAETPLAIWKDSFYRYLIFSLILFLLVFWILWFGDFKQEVVVKEPPRIAKVEIQKAAPKPKKIEEFKEEPTAEPPKNIEAKKEEKKQERKTPVKNDEAQKAQVKKPETTPKSQVKGSVKNKAPAPALNTKLPPTNVNQVGLLGSLKKTQSRNTVRADQVIDEGVVQQPIAGTEGQFVVKQPPTGTLAKQTVQGKDLSLSKASSTVSGGDSSSGSSVGKLVDVGGGNQFSIGYSNVGSELDPGSDPEEIVEGGLNKETVRRTLATYKKEIRTCYERALNIKPKIRGRVSYKWTITPKGATAGIATVKATTESPTLARCVQDVIKSIRWPSSKNGNPTVVKYPFEFQSKK